MVCAGNEAVPEAVYPVIPAPDGTAVQLYVVPATAELKATGVVVDPLQIDWLLRLSVAVGTGLIFRV